jgi:hypothetical protein
MRAISSVNVQSDIIFHGSTCKQSSLQFLVHPGFDVKYLGRDKRSSGNDARIQLKIAMIEHKMRIYGRIFNVERGRKPT